MPELATRLRSGLPAQLPSVTSAEVGIRFRRDAWSAEELLRQIDATRDNLPVTDIMSWGTPPGMDPKLMNPHIERFARVVNRYYPTSTITVEGFADPAGSQSYNVALTGSSDRANMRVSLSHLNQDGMGPGFNLDQTTASLNGGARTANSRLSNAVVCRAWRARACLCRNFGRLARSWIAHGVLRKTVSVCRVEWSSPTRNVKRFSPSARPRANDHRPR